MSFIIKIGLNQSLVKILEKRNVPSPVYYEKNKLLIGEIYEASYADIMSSGWENNPEILDNYITAACFISYSDGYCTICNDMSGMETVYYYHDGNKHMFYISDNFWDIISEIDPGYEMLDVDNVKLRMVLGGSLLSDETIIKGVKYLLPGTYMQYNAISESVTVERYKYLLLEETNKDLTRDVDLLNETMDRAMKDIKSHHSKDTVYGIGLSGGLDSRLALHYAIKNNMKCVCFNICSEKPHGLLRAKSVRMAQKVADAYNTPLHIVEWDKKDFEQNLYRKTEEYPNGPSLDGSTDVYKYVGKRLPAFDVLLTAGAGIGNQFFSSHYPKSIPNGITDFIVDDYIWGYFSGKKERAARIFFHKNQIRKFKYDWEKRLFLSQYNLIKNKVSDIIKPLNTLKCSEVETLINFRSIYFSLLTRYGAFESFFGEKRSYSIYCPWISKYGIVWNKDYLYDRKLLTELICRYMPKISMIGGESYQLAPGYSGGKIRQKYLKIIAVLDRLITGDGTHIVRKYWRNKHIKAVFTKKFQKRSTWFERVFNGIEISPNEVFKTNCYEMMSILDTKLLLDYLEEKCWK